MTTGPPPEGPATVRHQIPDAWIGEHVIVYHLAGSGGGSVTEASTRGTLVEVNDRGVVIPSDDATKMFIPWSAVATIARSTPAR